MVIGCHTKSEPPSTFIGPGYVAVALRCQVHRDTRYLVRQAGPADIRWLMKSHFDKAHDVDRITRIQSFRSQEGVKRFSKAGRHDGPGADGVHQDPVGGQALGQILRKAGDGCFGCGVGNNAGILPLNGVRREVHDSGPRSGT